MYWYKLAKKQSDHQIVAGIKKFLRSDPFVKSLFNEFNVSMDLIDSRLAIIIKPDIEMKGKFAQSNRTEIWLSKSLFEKGDFFKNNLHFVVHELVHWLIRQREREMYFADPEEIDAFTAAMTYQLIRGVKEDEVKKTFYPLIAGHFKTKENADKLFEGLMIRAKAKIRKHKGMPEKIAQNPTSAGMAIALFVTRGSFSYADVSSIMSQFGINSEEEVNSIIGTAQAILSQQNGGNMLPEVYERLNEIANILLGVVKNSPNGDSSLGYNQTDGLSDGAQAEGELNA